MEPCQIGDVFDKLGKQRTGLTFSVEAKFQVSNHVKPLEKMLKRLVESDRMGEVLLTSVL